MSWSAVDYAIPGVWLDFLEHGGDECVLVGQRDRAGRKFGSPASGHIGFEGVLMFEDGSCLGMFLQVKGL